MPHTTPTAALVTRDAPHCAGLGLRDIASADRRHRRDAMLIHATCVTAAAGWVYVFREMFWGTPTTALMLLILLAALITAGVLIKRTRGIALALTAAAAAIAATVIIGRTTSLNWGFQLGGVALVVAATAVILTGRRHRLPRTAATLIGAWIVPATYTAVPVIGGWVLLIAAAAVTAATSYQSERSRQLKVLRAARSAGIPIATLSLNRATPSTHPAASGVDTYTLHQRAEANMMTAELLDELPDDWYIFHSRISPAGDVIDHVVVGPPGVFVMRSELLAADLTIAPHPDAPDLTTWDIDGWPADSEPAHLLCDVATQIDGALLTPNGIRTVKAAIIPHGSVMTPQRGPQSVIGADGSLDGVEWVAPGALLDYLRTQPTLGRPTTFTEVLAAVVDQLLPAIG